MEQPEVTLTGDDAIVSEVVRERAAGFEARGFEFTGTKLEGSPRLGRFPVFSFLNRQTGLQIHVSFSSAGTGLNGGFVVTLVNKANRKLDLEDFLKLHGHPELTKYLTYRHPKPDIRSFAESFFDMLDGLLDTDLKPIIDGTTFEETPIDWMGYR